MRASIAFAAQALHVALLASLALSGCTGGVRPSAPSRSTTAAAAQQLWQPPHGEAPLGPAGLRQNVATRTLAPGIVYARIERGAAAAADAWTANVGFYRDPHAARADREALAAAGFAPRLDASAGTDLAGASLGSYLSVGRFATRDEAGQAAARIAAATADRLRPSVRNTALAGGPADGPWIVNVLAIAPKRADARLALALPGGDDLGGGGETVSAAAARLGALAGVNGGFFSNVNPFAAPHPPRSPVGATVVDGRLVATALGGRPGVVIENRRRGGPRAWIASRLATQVRVLDARGGAATVAAINRPILGTAVNCGEPASAPTRQPAQDAMCTNFDDLVLYDASYLRGAASNTRVDAGYRGASYQLQVDARGRVVGGQAQLGAPAPPGGYVLQGLGTHAQWLSQRSAPGTRLRIRSQVQADGRTIAPATAFSVVEAGPLLSAPDLAANAAREGFGPNVGGDDRGEAAAAANRAGPGAGRDVPHPGWYEGWYVNRNGRTAIGTTADGTILLVEIAGRQPGLSLGASIPETAAVMRWLGAVRSLNLDGGGSSGMVVDGVQVGHPSDAGGERAVGGTLLLLPR
ncbi:phosphodiester glycosidase family protein [Lysobacter enzymogenes]|uniref:phosphodiester glycosidase family protein n=1 Tax=Lysobacter enzymogenes TaxID=69 RepID=UPI0037481A90